MAYTSQSSDAGVNLHTDSSDNECTVDKKSQLITTNPQFKVMKGKIDWENENVENSGL